MCKTEAEISFEGETRQQQNCCDQFSFFLVDTKETGEYNLKGNVREDQRENQSFKSVKETNGTQIKDTENNSHENVIEAQPVRKPDTCSREIIVNNVEPEKIDESSVTSTSTANHDDKVRAKSPSVNKATTADVDPKEPKMEIKPDKADESATVSSSDESKGCEPAKVDDKIADLSEDHPKIINHTEKVQAQSQSIYEANTADASPKEPKMEIEPDKTDESAAVSSSDESKAHEPAKVDDKIAELSENQPKIMDHTEKVQAESLSMNEVNTGDVSPKEPKMEIEPEKADESANVSSSDESKVSEPPQVDDKIADLSENQPKIIDHNEKVQEESPSMNEVNTTDVSPKEPKMEIKPDKVDESATVSSSDESKASEPAKVDDKIADLSENEPKIINHTENVQAESPSMNEANTADICSKEPKMEIKSDEADESTIVSNSDESKASEPAQMDDKIADLSENQPKIIDHTENVQAESPSMNEANTADICSKEPKMEIKSDEADESTIVSNSDESKASEPAQMDDKIADLSENQPKIIDHAEKVQAESPSMNEVNTGDVSPKEPKMEIKPDKVDESATVSSSDESKASEPAKVDDKIADLSENQPKVIDHNEKVQAQSPSMNEANAAIVGPKEPKMEIRSDEGDESTIVSNSDESKAFEPAKVNDKIADLSENQPEIINHAEKVQEESPSPNEANTADVGPKEPKIEIKLDKADESANINSSDESQASEPAKVDGKTSDLSENQPKIMDHTEKVQAESSSMNEANTADASPKESKMEIKPDKVDESATVSSSDEFKASEPAKVDGKISDLSENQPKKMDHTENVQAESLSMSEANTADASPKEPKMEIKLDKADESATVSSSDESKASEPAKVNEKIADLSENQAKEQDLTEKVQEESPSMNEANTADICPKEPKMEIKSDKADGSTIGSNSDESKTMVDEKIADLCQKEPTTADQLEEVGEKCPSKIEATTANVGPKEPDMEMKPDKSDESTMLSQFDKSKASEPAMADSKTANVHEMEAPASDQSERAEEKLPSTNGESAVVSDSDKAKALQSKFRPNELVSDEQAGAQADLAVCEEHAKKSLEAEHEANFENPHREIVCDQLAEKIEAVSPEDTFLVNPDDKSACDHPAEASCRKSPAGSQNDAVQMGTSEEVVSDHSANESDRKQIAEVQGNQTQVGQALANEPEQTVKNGTPKTLDGAAHENPRKEIACDLLVEKHDQNEAVQVNPDTNPLCDHPVVVSNDTDTDTAGSQNKAAQIDPSEKTAFDHLVKQSDEKERSGSQTDETKVDHFIGNESSTKDPEGHINDTAQEEIGCDQLAGKHAKADTGNSGKDAIYKHSSQVSDKTETLPDLKEELTCNNPTEESLEERQVGGQDSGAQVEQTVHEKLGEQSVETDAVGGPDSTICQDSIEEIVCDKSTEKPAPKDVTTAQKDAFTTAHQDDKETGKNPISKEEEEDLIEKAALEIVRSSLTAAIIGLNSSGDSVHSGSKTALSLHESKSREEIDDMKVLAELLEETSLAGKA